MARAYTTYAPGTTSTPQSQQIPGRETEMTPNSAGGVGFSLSDWDRLWRFLALGSEGGTYYVSEKKLTEQNARVVLRCLKEDGPRVVALARDVNVNNRAPKVDQQLFTLALAIRHNDAATKAAATAAATEMLRTGTHLLHFTAMLKSLGGWNRSNLRLLKRWFADDVNRVAFQVLKYQSRDNWSQRDVLRVAHPKPLTEAHNQVMAWVTKKLAVSEPLSAELPEILATYVKMLVSDEPVLDRALAGLAAGLPREALPTEVLQTPEVQRALLPSLPLHALLRNLGNLSGKGVLRDADAELVAQKLSDSSALRRSRVHPFAVLLATLVYREGHGIRGKKTWAPLPVILSALEDAYELAFTAVEPTGKRILVGIDVSASMSKPCVGTPVPSAVAAAAMALTLARLEPHATVVQFGTVVRKKLLITRRTGIASLVDVSGGGTNVASPVEWALEQGHVYDAFIVLTDDETWHGTRHPTEALQAYRVKHSRSAKLVCCSMAANHASVVDPQDPLQLGTAGLDANLPTITAEFIKA